MAKKKVGRRVGGQIGSQRHPNQCVAHSLNVAVLSQMQESGGTLACRNRTDCSDRVDRDAEQGTPSPAVAANELDENSPGGFHIATTGCRTRYRKRRVAPRPGLIA